ncbi:hypothetical protein BGZ96_010401 [Linnemannia gamsii]|uniref:Uncharacterized protein n=1 Tax=Linnemannia gamsii TaxID=64522 RepID=A0ABQ7JUR5_9FUNG|nr:hypothetical protein BGZ96_010401 [Linnemannia gamsii]
MSILKFIPNLEELWLEDQHGDYFTRHLPSPQSPLKTRLKILYLIPFRPYNPNYCMIVGILPHAPELLEIGLPYLNHEIATDISTFCPRLQTFIQTNTSESSHSSELPCGIINSLGILLSNCPNLKKIDGSNHQIGAQFLLTHPWICQRLEVLRCRIVGVDRLSEEEEIDYHQGLLLRRLGWPLPEAETLAVEKYIHQICPQHQQIYAQLAKMTHLRVLEIGMEYRNLSHEKNFRFHPVSFIHRGAQTYIDYGPPPQNTLELSLTSGLEQLSTLRNLKVFGFEGVDCRIDEEELRWMAIAWPKLRVMRGLQDIEARFPNSIYDGERWYRRWFMRMLRPNVKHEHRLVEPICFVWQHKY